MKWGQKVDSPFVRKPDPTQPGWRDDPERPGIERYWTGSGWDDEIAPRAKPDPPLRQARMVALGVLVATAAVFTIWRVQQPSDLECSTQRLEVATGQRLAVESACEGR